MSIIGTACAAKRRVFNPEKRMNILLVDDDEVIRMGMRKLIERAGKDWTVCGEASDGAMALEMLDDGMEADLIICDVRMPIMDGLELAETIRNKREYSPKIIMLSGFNDFEYVRSAFMNGACDYILKPFKKDDFIALIQRMENQINEEQRTRQSVDRNRDFLRSEVLKSLAQCTDGSAEEGIRHLQELGIETLDKDFCVISIAADQYFRQFSQVDQYESLLDEVLSRTLEFIEADRSGFSVVNCIIGQEILLLCFGEGSDNLKLFSKKLFEHLNSTDTENSVTMGISGIYRQAAELPIAFSQAGEAVMARFYLGQKQYIEYDAVKGKSADIQYDITPCVNSLVHYITLGDYMGAREVLDRVFMDLSYCHADMFRKYMRSIVDMLSMRIEAFGSFFSQEAAQAVYYIDYLNTYRELKTYMNTLIKSGIEFISSEKDKRSEKRIELARQYMESHYCEPLSLNDIADYVELNPSYFSNLFKTETGINFSEYLLNIRMNKAKELLRDPKIRIYEIGNLVGYDDAVSFGRAFKKKWGISPKEYRNMVY